MPRGGHRIDHERGEGARQQLHLRHPDVAVVVRAADHQAHGTPDLREVRRQQLRLAGVGHGEIRPEGGIEIAPRGGRVPDDR